MKLCSVCFRILSFFGITQRRCKVIVCNDNKVLLVRCKGRGEWELPGGVIKPNQSDRFAAQQIIQKQLGLQIETFANPLGLYADTFLWCEREIIVLVAGLVVNPTGITTSREIKDAQFFAQDVLPKNISNTTRMRLNEYSSGKRRYFSRWK